MTKIDILKQLLTSFDTKLISLEKSSKEHLLTIEATAVLTQSITSTCLTIQNNLKQKSSKESASNSRKTLPISSINKTFQTKYGSKTPLKSRNISQGRFSKLLTKDILTTRSTHTKLLSRNSLQKVVPSFTLTQTKKFLPQIKNQMFNHWTRNSKELVTSKTSTDDSKAKFSMKKNVSFNNKKATKKGVVPSKSLDETNISKIFSFDPKHLLDKDEPLLIGPILDIDFIISANIKDNNLLKNCFVSCWMNKCAIEDIYQDYLPLIFEYLKKKELIPLMLVSKKYSKHIKQLLITNIEKEKEYYETRLTLLDSTNHNANQKDILDLSKFQFSKGAIKAVSLLNDSILAKLFAENNIPKDDILLIYYIYFQLINHELAQERNTKVFWKNCCQYFLTAPDGQIGNLIQNDLTSKVILTTENITNILNIIKDNAQKIIPSYFSKLCGTTGLIVFFIKDVLDYIGISNDKKSKSQSNIAYKVIINLLEVKIDKISHMGNYCSDHVLIN